MESIFYLLLLTAASLSVNSALIVYPAELEHVNLPGPEVPGDVSISREHVSSSVSSSSDVIARIMNSMPQLELETEPETKMVTPEEAKADTADSGSDAEGENQIIFESEPKLEPNTNANPVTVTSGLRGGKIPPADLETLNSTSAKTQSVPEAVVLVEEPTTTKPILEEPEKLPVVDMKEAPPAPAEDSVENQIHEDHDHLPEQLDVEHVKIPLESDKSHHSHLHPSYLLQEILSNAESAPVDDGPIILRPKTAARKSVIIEIAQRPCLHCPDRGEALSIGRHALGAGALSGGKVYRLADEAPQSRETPIELDSRELMRRRKNFQRIASLLPGHRTPAKSGSSLLLANQRGKIGVLKKAPVLNPNGYQPAARSFWSTMFSLWPFGNKPASAANVAAQTPNSAKNLRLEPGMSQNSDEEIIIRPKPSPTPKPMVMEEILVPSSSANTYNTMNEIHEELNKQNTVKLQSQSQSQPQAGESGPTLPPPPTATVPVISAMGSEPQLRYHNAYRGLLPIYTIVSSEGKLEARPRPKPTRAPSEREETAQISPTITPHPEFPERARGTYPPVLECPYSPYLAYRLVRNQP